jgi:hypothetical protein
MASRVTACAYPACSRADADRGGPRVNGQADPQTRPEAPPTPLTLGTPTRDSAGEPRRERQAKRNLGVAQVSGSDIASIVEALKTKALKGDVQASRELREWLRQAKEEGTQPLDVLALLSREQRAQVAQWLSDQGKAPA